MSQCKLNTKRIWEIADAQPSLEFPQIVSKNNSNKKKPSSEWQLCNLETLCWWAVQRRMAKMIQANRNATGTHSFQPWWAEMRLQQQKSTSVPTPVSWEQESEATLDADSLQHLKTGIMSLYGRVRFRLQRHECIESTCLMSTLHPASGGGVMVLGNVFLAF